VNTIVDEFDVVNWDAGVSDDILGAECNGCRRLLTFAGNFFPKNSSYKSGYEPLCWKCKQSPILSIAEHTARLFEMNYNSEGTKRQRNADQDMLRGERPGRAMECSLFLTKLLHVVPNLFVKPGGYYEDLALYVTSGVAKPEWAGQNFKYIGFVTLGVMPEYSVYEFDRARDILLRATQIGWRSVLIRFVENNILSEEQCNAEFGYPSGGENSIWYKKLHNHRNAKKIA
jgi:hypothetical protein